MGPGQFALMIAGVAAAGAAASAQVADKSAPPVAKPAAEPEQPAADKKKPSKPTTRPAPQQPTADKTKPAPKPTTRPYPPSQQHHPQVLPTGPTRPTPQRPVDQGWDGGRPSGVRPPPNWEGQHWRHGTWQPANHRWYDHWYGFGRIVLYSEPYFRGRGLYLRRSEENLRYWNFNDKAESVRVSGRWLLCSKTRFRGTCRVVGSNRPTLYNLNLNRNVTSVRFLGY